MILCVCVYIYIYICLRGTKGMCGAAKPQTRLEIHSLSQTLVWTQRVKFLSAPCNLARCFRTFEPNLLIVRSLLLFIKFLRAVRSSCRSALPNAHESARCGAALVKWTRFPARQHIHMLWHLPICYIITCHIRSCHNMLYCIVLQYIMMIYHSVRELGTQRRDAWTHRPRPTGPRGRRQRWHIHIYIYIYTYTYIHIGIHTYRHIYIYI